MFTKKGSTVNGTSRSSVNLLKTQLPISVHLSPKTIKDNPILKKLENNYIGAFNG